MSFDSPENDNLENDNHESFDNPEYVEKFRHTCSHVLAHAVKKLFPDARLGIGPAIENGFYYDFDMTENLNQENLTLIEDEMKKIINMKLPMERFELSREEAIKLMSEKGEDYKVELINDLPEDEVISFYKQGDFVDLCAGPHLENISDIKAFKLLSVTGAYWRGSEKNKMLQRIYGTCFPDKAYLNEHLQRLEEAKKRDHNKLGRELEFFTTVDIIGQGLPILLPKGTKVVQILQRFIEDEEEKRGYLLTKTPLMAKSDLYKISGHWDHYRDGMFVIGDEEKDDEVFALRPMTCPFQFQAYLTKTRSYRELPLRYNETSTLFRNESSGEMHGLIRVRQFTISEGHIACTPEQVSGEFKGALELAKYVLDVLGLSEDITYRFSKWDENNRDKYIGSAESWESVQNFMRNILDEMKIDYVEAEGEAAFYGPKLDLQIKNVHGKEDTIVTIQIDFQLAERFDMEYVDKDGTKKRPFVIHRTSVGCYERTLALLIEKYAGAFPVWLAPEQVRILPVSSAHNDYAYELKEHFMENGFRVVVDDDDEKLGKKIRSAQTQKVPYSLVVGDKESQSGTVAVRSRKEGDLGVMDIESFLEKLDLENKSKSL